MTDSSSSSFQRIEAIFQDAIKLPRSERDAFVIHTCADDKTLVTSVQHLLTAFHEAGSFLETPVAAFRDTEDIQSIPLQIEGQRIGKYEIQRLIASGGMGNVYEAIQQNPQRTVALKVMRQGLVTLATRRRFEFEGQVLGRLQHHGIAQIFEAGIADTPNGPLPFFAMELISGNSLKDYANNHDLGTHERLELMVSICEAVHHAHLHGIIHRDLKPDNILVTQEGQPKILDFGIARTTDSDIQATTLQTDMGQLIGTIPYMSPEQVEGDSDKLDYRSDVYSLGVICYELLSGELPLDVRKKMIPEAVRIIREQEPKPLSTFHRVFRGDLDTIVAKALEKDKLRRYTSASDFAADLKRFMNDEPISARPPSTMYQLGKFTRRHKPLVGGLVATLTVLIIGLILTTQATIRARQAEQHAQELTATESTLRAQAENSAAVAETVRDFLQEILAGSDPEGSLGPQATILEALQRAAKRVDNDKLSDQPEVEAAVNNTVGTTYHNLGMYDQAATYFHRALDTYEKTFGSDHPDTLEMMNNLGCLLTDQGKLDEAERMLRTSIEGFGRVLGMDHAQRQTSLNNLTIVLTKKGNIEEAASISKQLLDARMSSLGEDHPLALLSMNNLAITYQRLGRLGEAEDWIRRALTGRRKILGEKHPRTIITLDNFALILEKRGKLDEAEGVSRKAVDLFTEVRGQEHPDTLIAMYSLARLLHKKGNLEESISLYRRSLDLRKKVIGETHADTLYTMRHLADALVDQNRFDEAESVFSEVISIIRSSQPESPWDVYDIPMVFGNHLVEKKRFNEAESMMLYGYDELKKRLDSDHRGIKKANERLFHLYEKWGKHDMAAKYASQ